MVEVSASIVDLVKKEDIIKTIYDLEMAHIDYFHIDIYDGEFVPTNSIEKALDYTTTVKQISNIPLDVHFMVKDPKKFADEYLPLEPNIITFHVEALETEGQVLDLIKYIKDNKCRVGIAISPATKTESIFKYLDKIHILLVMTIVPGYSGTGLIPETIDKVRELREYIDKNELDVDIEVDGGIKIENLAELKKAGANILATATTLIKAEDKKDVVNKLKM